MTTEELLQGSNAVLKKHTFLPVPTEISHLDFLTLSEWKASEFCPVMLNPDLLSSRLLARIPYLVLLGE